MTRTTEELQTIATVASTRAAALREHAARLTGEALEPIRRALLTRAGELDLTAAVLRPLEEPAEQEGVLQATA